LFYSIRGRIRHSVSESLHNHFDVFFKNIKYITQNNVDSSNKLLNWNWPLHNIIQYTIPRTLYLYLLHIHAICIAHCCSFIIYSWIRVRTVQSAGYDYFELLTFWSPLLQRVVYCTLNVWFLIRYKRWPRVQE